MLEKENLENEIGKLQELVNELAKSPYGRYVKEHRLGLINSDLSVVDRLLDAGILKTPR
ncbi:MAG: hypothetical protein ACP5US_10315 [Candidatus Kryptoniota bacterium]